MPTDYYYEIHNDCLIFFKKLEHSRHEIISKNNGIAELSYSGVHSRFCEYQVNDAIVIEWLNFCFNNFAIPFIIFSNFELKRYLKFSNSKHFYSRNDVLFKLMLLNNQLRIRVNCLDRQTEIISVSTYLEDEGIDSINHYQNYLKNANYSKSYFSVKFDDYDESDKCEINKEENKFENTNIYRTETLGDMKDNTQGVVLNPTDDLKLSLYKKRKKNRLIL